MLTLEDAIAIAKPHMDRIRNESEITRLRRFLKYLAESTFDSATRTAIEAELSSDVDGGWKVGRPLPDRPV